MLKAFRAAPVDHLLDSSGCSETLSDGLVKNNSSAFFSLSASFNWFQGFKQSFTNHQKHQVQLSAGDDDDDDGTDDDDDDVEPGRTSSSYFRGFPTLDQEPRSL